MRDKCKNCLHSREKHIELKNRKITYGECRKELGVIYKCKCKKFV